MAEQKEEIQYDFKKTESSIREFWEKEKIYQFNPASKKKIYSIDTPPPTVSGKMHIGHASSYSQQDFIARYKRMKGFEVFYPFGTDDNGLPTERLVEKVKGIKARDFKREDFIQICQDFLKDELPAFIQDWKNIGISCDFSIYYSTINEHCRRISQWSFLDLLKKGRVYRKEAPAMWCPECHTGISQMECQDKILKSKFNDIVFKINGEKVVIATTRPELLPACVAVFYNPDDERYKKFKGKEAEVPLFGFKVPVMEDSKVSMEKGTGIVMCCTFGDQTDMEWQRKYNLPIKEAISKEGKMTELAGRYEGLKIKEARETIINDLKEAGLLASQKDIEHNVNVHERCGTEIEFVKSKQWFIKWLDLKEEMLKWGSKFNWHPKHMKTRYDNWVNGLQWDWLISRQRHFGVPFPVWYCEKCGAEIFADEKNLPVDPLKDKPKKKCKCGSSEFIPEKDVLDTWFTSAMTPRLSIELMPKQLWKKLFPMNLRPQAHEIITFWLFNTTFKSNLHYRKNPFKDVMISGYVTLKGEKMSKSKGNVVEPQPVIDKFGADALRFWAAGAKLGEDFDYQEKDILTGKKMITKLWNASKFVFMNLRDYTGEKPKEFEKIDKLFLEKLNSLVKTASEAFENYEYYKAKSEIEKFFWQSFCGNYLEIVKDRIYNKSGDKKLSAQYTLYHSLLALIKMTAPFMPYITEELYQKYFRKDFKEKSIHLTEWPEFRKEKKSEELDIFYSLLEKIRHEKSLAKKSVKAEIILTLEPKDIEKLKDMIDDFKAVANAREIKEGKFRVDFV